MLRKYKMSLKSLTVALGAALILSQSALFAAPAKPAAPKVYVPVGPKVLTVVAGRPFEAVPATGPSKVSVTLCPEETESATFTVRYSKPLANVRVAAVGDFVGPGTLERGNFKVSQVVGDQLINEISTSSGAVFTTANIGPQPVQFWVDVTVPRRTPPGLYKGAIGFYYENKTFDVVSMEVNVLPLRLVGSSKQYAMYTYYGPAGQGEARLNGDQYKQFLQAVSDLGIRLVTVYAAPSETTDALSAYSAAGLGSPTFLTTYSCGCYPPTVEEVAAIDASKRTLGLNKMLFFGLHNPTEPDAIDRAEEQLKTMKKARAATIAALSTEDAVTRLEPVLDQLDYHVDMERVQSYIAGTTRPEGVKWQWYWWDAKQSALANRRYAGVGLWMSGLYGCTPVWMPDEGATVSPLEEVKSLKMIALREGIDDTRYLTTFMKALRELKDLKREKDKDYIATTEEYVNAFLRKPLNTITPADLAAFRAKVVEYSIALNKRL